MLDQAELSLDLLSIGVARHVFDSIYRSFLRYPRCVCFQVFSQIPFLVMSLRFMLLCSNFGRYRLISQALIP